MKCLIIARRIRGKEDREEVLNALMRFVKENTIDDESILVSDNEENTLRLSFVVDKCFDYEGEEDEVRRYLYQELPHIPVNVSLRNPFERAVKTGITILRDEYDPSELESFSHKMS